VLNRFNCPASEGVSKFRQNVRAGYASWLETIILIAIAPHWGINFHRSATHSFNIYCILFDELLARFGVPMRNLHELEDSALIDMLAEYTQRYTFLFKNVTHLRYDEEFQRCKRTIQFIILELEQRKRTTNNDISILNSDPGS